MRPFAPLAFFPLCASEHGLAEGGPFLSFSLEEDCTRSIGI